MPSKLIHAGMLVLLTLWVTNPLYGQDIDEQQRNLQVETLLKKVATGEDFEIDAAAYVPDLIEIIGEKNQLNSDLAIRALQRLKSKASPAISVLSLKLDAKEQATRSYAVEALVSIGDGSIPALENVLMSSSGRARAAAVTALIRLKQFDIETLKHFTQDDDARVRAAVATTLAKSGKPGVSLLTELLEDPEMAVAVVAANSLKVNQTDTPLAVAKLIKALKRPHFGWTAANALASYGTDANRAIPGLINARPYEYRISEIRWDDAAETLLKHLGPPDPRDLIALCELLSDEDEKKQSLAARSISMLGIQGRAAVPYLKPAISTTIKRFHQIEKKYADVEPSPEDNSYSVNATARELVSAVWYVTNDFDQFDKIRRDASLALGEPVGLEELDACLDLQPGEIELLRAMLTHEQSMFHQIALRRVVELGETAKPLLRETMEHVGDDKSHQLSVAVQALISLGPSVAAEIAQEIVELRRKDEISPFAFAEIVYQLGIRHGACRKILEEGLTKFDGQTAVASARALLSTSGYPKYYASMVIQMARDGEFRLYEVVNLLREVDSIPGDSMEFFVEEIGSLEFSRQRAAVDAIGRFGPAATSVLPALQKILKKNYDKQGYEGHEMHLTTLRSICQITEDFSPARAAMDQAMKSKGWRKKYFLADAFAGSGAVGNLFVPDIVRFANGSETHLRDSSVRLLQAIGTTDAIPALRKLAESKDWEIRCQARKALQELRYQELRRRAK